MLRAFVDLCNANVDHSFAQNYQDLFALFASGCRTDGYFVEFGALNGRDFSNTYALEKLGWTGIVAEPHPAYANQVTKNRSCHFSTLCVFDKTGDTIKFRIVNGRPAMSAIAETQLNDDKVEFRNKYREVSVSTITLNALLDAYDAPPVIDFISIDTEGSEERILRAFDFGRRRISSFCIEHNYVQRDAIAEIMHANGYRRMLEELSAHDDWWIHEDAPSPAAPPGFQIAGRFNEVFEIQQEARKAKLAEISDRLQTGGQ